MMNWINKKRNKKGFTLIELIVVIAILGILAAIAIPRLGGFRDTADQSAAEAEARTILTALATKLAANPNDDLSSFSTTSSLEDLTGPLNGSSFSTAPSVNANGNIEFVYLHSSGISVTVSNGAIQ